MPNRRTAFALRPATNDRVLLMDAGTVALTRAATARIDPLGPADADRSRAGFSGAIVALSTARINTV
jgi:hypothetical protein